MTVMLGLAVALTCALSVSAAGAQQSSLLLSDAAIDAALLHGPWPVEVRRDASNRVSQDPSAIALGQALFFSHELSRTKTVSCASCHNPDTAFSDGRAVATGARTLPRNTLALGNVGFHRWFGWDGSTDNLWAQSLVPILNSEEMDLTFKDLSLVATIPEFRNDYIAIFGDGAAQSAVEVSVNLAKALAAYQATLTTGQTSFDKFRDALQAQDYARASEYPQAAQRGLSLFLGRGQCAFCHSGPLFTNGEFHDAGVGYFLKDGGVDEGRHRGLQQLKSSAFTLDGPYSDDPERSGAWAVRQVQPKHADFGTFRVPGLRNVANTAPYMHNGSLSQLSDVVEHYSTIDLERLHADGEAILEPLNLTPLEAADLVAFLETLSAD